MKCNYLNSLQVLILRELSSVGSTCDEILCYMNIPISCTIFLGTFIKEGILCTRIL